MARIIRASEVGEYCYCARSWWLRHVAGLTPSGQARRSAGTGHHRRHGVGVRLSGALRALGLVLLVAAAGLALTLR